MTMYSSISRFVPVVKAYLRYIFLMYLRSKSATFPSCSSVSLVLCSFYLSVSIDYCCRSTSRSLFTRYSRVIVSISLLTFIFIICFKITFGPLHLFISKRIRYQLIYLLLSRNKDSTLINLLDSPGIIY